MSKVCETAPVITGEQMKGGKGLYPTNLKRNTISEQVGCYEERAEQLQFALEEGFRRVSLENGKV